DLIFTHMRFDRERGGLTDARQFLQRARRAMHLVADAADVDDDVILAVGVDQSLELADHDPNRSDSASFRGRANGSGPLGRPGMTRCDTLLIPPPPSAPLSVLDAPASC